METQQHQQAVKDLVSLGGVVDIDDRVPGRQTIALNFDRSRVTDAVLAPLQGLSHLHYLVLSQTRVTDQVMQVLRTHPQIRRLDISDTLITDDGLKCLKYAQALEELYLGERITDKGLRYVRTLTNLRVLALEDTKATDKALRNLNSLDRLEYLFLSVKQISSKSVQWLVKLARLQTINLLGHNNCRRSRPG